MEQNNRDINSNCSFPGEIGENGMFHGRFDMTCDRYGFAGPDVMRKKIRDSLLCIWRMSSKELVWDIRGITSITIIELTMKKMQEVR